MASFREVDSPIDYRSSDSNRTENRYWQRYGGRRPLRSNLERQVSDKHLKRRAQMIQLESNNNISSHNHRFRYLHQHTSPTGGNSLSLNDLHHQYENQFQLRRRPNYGGFFSAHNKKQSYFIMLLVLLTLMLILLLTGPTVWYSMILSSAKAETITMSSVLLGGDTNDEYGNDGRNDTNRSYQDLADSIRRLRIRRQVLKKEKVGEWEERKVGDGDENIHYKGNEFEDDRLKRLEQKIQMEQNIKVREELLSSTHNGGENEFIEASASRKDVGRSSEDQLHNKRQNIDRRPTNAKIANTDALKEKAMSESIEALKRLNSKNGLESDHNDPVDD